MDVKENFLIERTYSAIRSGNFHELDVLTLLILLRNHAAKDSLIKEFGDFVAHRKKDRGKLKCFLEHFQCALHGNSNFNSKNIVTNVHIRDSLNEIFRAINLPELTDELANQITVCIISLLQSVKIIEVQKTKISHLSVGISSKYITLLGSGIVPAGHVLDWTVLVAKNCLQDAASYPSTFMHYDHVVEAGSANGVFELAQRLPVV